jgi:tyrosine decarboxylase/aspartate 1-decarboxylase
LEEHGHSEQEVLALLEEAYRKNHHFKNGRILSSMCTAPHEIAIKAHMRFIESNLGNPDLYPGTKLLETEVIKLLGNILHGHNVSGHMTSGGTEANITALWIAKKMTGRGEVLFPKSAHFSIIKALDLLGLTPVEVDLDGKYRMSVDDVETKLSENTCAVVGMAGSTELGVIDPIEKLSELCNENVFLHVDAAFGGFVIPFLNDLGYEPPKFDFELPGVNSLNTDPHKMGISTIPAGALIYSDERFIDGITVDAPYLISKKHSTLTGTRGSAAVAATYAVLKKLGRKGFIDIVKECMMNTDYLVNKIEELGLELAIKPVMNVIGIKFPDPEKVIHELAKQNWFVSKGRYPSTARIVVMPHVTRQVIDQFLPDFEKTCRALGEI